MQRNNHLIKFIYYPVLYICVAAVIGYIEGINADWLQIKYEKVKAGIIFLTSLYFLLYFPFVFIQHTYTDRSGFIFLVIMVLKVSFVMGFLFLFLKPNDIENKREILLFLMNYFVLLAVDLAIKMRLMK